jgi:hypothetical protein
MMDHEKLLMNEGRPASVAVPAFILPDSSF